MITDESSVSIQKPYFGSIVTGSVSTTSAAAAAIVPSLQLAAATAVLADGSKGPRTIPTKVTLAPPPLPTVVRPSKPTLSTVGQGRPVVATPATVEKRQMVRCDDRLTFGSRTLAGIVISSGPGGHFETYEVVEALNVNNMLAKFEAADPSCVDGPEDPRRKAEIMAAVKSHFSAPCRRMPPGKVPKIGMLVNLQGLRVSTVQCCVLTTFTGFSRQIRTKLRDWAVWPVRAALSTNDSKTRYTFGKGRTGNCKSNAIVRVPSSRIGL